MFKKSQTPHSQLRVIVIINGIASIKVINRIRNANLKLRIQILVKKDKKKMETSTKINVTKRSYDSDDDDDFDTHVFMLHGDDDNDIMDNSLMMG